MGKNGAGDTSQTNAEKTKGRLKNRSVQMPTFNLNGRRRRERRVYLLRVVGPLEQALLAEALECPVGAGHPQQGEQANNDRLADKGKAVDHKCATSTKDGRFGQIEQVHITVLTVGRSASKQKAAHCPPALLLTQPFSHDPNKSV
jgi:hypothetical protein